MSDKPISQSVVTRLLRADSDSQLSQVTLFTDQAWAKRQATIKASKGLNRFQFEILAFHVDTDSVQARVFGEGELLSVQYKTIPVTTHPSEKIKLYIKEKETIERSVKKLKSEKAIKEKQSAFLDGILDFSHTELHKSIKTNFPSPQDIESMVGFLGKQFQELSGAILELDRNIKETNKELAVIEQKLKQLKRPEKKQLNVIEVLFDSRRGDQEISIEISYAARQASWEPVYKVEVDEKLDKVNLTMFARIEQQTGEDWDNVQVAVSNAVPLKGTALPEPDSWRVYVPSPAYPLGDVVIGAAAAEPVEVEAGAIEEDLDGVSLEELEATIDTPPEASFRQASTKELPLAFEYSLPQPVTHASGSDDTLMPLFSRGLDGKFFIYTIPKKDPLGYMVCRATPDQALLPGRLNVHFGGRYVGGTWLSEKKAGEELLVNLGVETGLKVKREKVTDTAAETFLGKVERSTKAREMLFLTTLENLKETNLEVHVVDAVPVSNTDRIQIKGVELSPEPSEFKFLDKEGVCKWIVEMNPKSTQKITCRFFIKHPKDIVPAGL